MLLAGTSIGFETTPEASHTMFRTTTKIPGCRRKSFVEPWLIANRRARRITLACESLEGRALLTGVGVDYTLMGGQWDNTKPISFSIADDGAVWDAGTNDVNAELNAEFGNSSWRNTVAAALQTWAVAANLDFVPSSDGLLAFNTPGLSQGDSRFGDIRIAGYSLATNAIAQTYGPPPNGSTAAGDVKLNTSYTFGPTGQWDFETVMIHELGHSLGLGESPQPSSVMYTYYSGVRHDLSSYDVEGIQSLYGPRLADSYQSRGEATSPTSAVDLSGSLNNSQAAVINGLSLNSIGDSEYFAVTAPALQGATLQVNAVANGHSLMSPKVSVIDAATGATIAVDAHPDQYSDTASVAIPDAQAGHRYLIVVTGATQNEFAVGNYSLSVGFNGGTSIATGTATTQAPVPATPTSSTTTTTPTASTSTTPTSVATTTTSTPVAVATPQGTVATVDPYSANTSFAKAAELGAISGLSLIQNVTLASGQDVRVFVFEPASAGVVYVASANDMIQIGDSASHAVASGRGLISFTAPLAGARYYVILTSPSNAPVANASFAVQVVPTAIWTSSAATTTPTPVTVGHTVPSGASHKTKSKAKHKSKA